jgi:hypothetical protein
VSLSAWPHQYDYFTTNSRPLILACRNFNVRNPQLKELDAIALSVSRVRKHTERALSARISIDHSAANKSYWGVSERICLSLAIEGCDCTPMQKTLLFSKQNNTKESRINPDSATLLNLRRAQLLQSRLFFPFN